MLPRPPSSRHAPAARDRLPEPAISDDPTAAILATFLPEDEVLTAARERAAEVGAPAVSPTAGATLRFLAAVVGARAAVDVGTGAGVAAVWLLRGMRPDGVLTSVDAEAEHQRLARETLAEAGFSPSRARLIAGDAGDVLPRLSDGAYDLVFCSGRASDYAGYLAEAARLLRPGGVAAFNGMVRGRMTESGSRDPEVVALRGLLTSLRDDERWVPTLLPVDTGLLVAVRS